MACLTGKIIHLNPISTSDAGRKYQSGVLELPNKEIQDFVIFDLNESLNPEKLVQMTGNTKGGTFMANWARDAERPIVNSEAPTRVIKEMPRADMIDGKIPIDWLMDILGADVVTARLKEQFKDLSNILKSPEERKRYRELLELWIAEAKLGYGVKIATGVPDMF